MQLCSFRDEASDAGWQGAVENGAVFDRNDRARFVVAHVKMGRVAGEKQGALLRLALTGRREVSSGI
jgi:hypothetical protein